MTRKLLFSIVGLALIAVTGIAALNATWTSCTIIMHAGTATVVTIAQYEDCTMTIPLDTYDWNGIVQAETYQMEYYVLNTGTVGLYITYLPTDLTFYDDQARMTIWVTVIEWGNNACQDNPENFPLPEKDPFNPILGYFLGPGKWIKLRVEMYVDSVVSGGVYDWDFVIHGSTA